MQERERGQREYRKGMLAVLGCSTLWGVLPIYWKALIPIDSWIIILYRIFLVCLSALVLARLRYSWGEIFQPLVEDRRRALKFFLAGGIITVNWSTYIWAVNAGYVIQASIGYYIEPLMVCVFGILFFHEKFTPFRWAALVFVVAAVLIQLVHFRQIPGIALGIAVTFAVYAAIKKTVEEPPLLSLVYETVFFAPFALAAVVWLEVTGKGALSVGEPYQYALLLLCGLLTVTPLGLFAVAAQKVPLFTLGLMEYISPSLSLILGIFLYREPFDKVLCLSVGIIWIGLVFFTIGEYRAGKEAALSLRAGGEDHTGEGDR